MSYGPTTEQVRAAKGWIADCVWEDEPDIDRLTIDQVIRGVNRHYDGGWEQFVADAGMDYA